MITSMAAPQHVSKGGRQLVAIGFVAVIVLVVGFVVWLKWLRDDDSD